MKVAVFSTEPYDKRFLEAANEGHGHELVFYETRLTAKTTVLADESPAVCVFVNDVLDAEVLKKLAEHGTKLIALRCAGFNNVDLETAEQLGMTVLRVPAYSPHAVAEHAVALILALNRHIHRAHMRVTHGNFKLNGLLGFDIHGLTVGVVGTGKIGAIFAGLMKGFGCNLLGYDVYENEECKALGLAYVDLPALLAQSDIVSLHCPLTPETHHLINENTLNQMKRGAMLINTSRGPLIDTEAVIEALKEGQLGHLAIDVYEEEADLFFHDLSDQVIQDDVFARLLTFPNVIVTSHQAFFTKNALEQIGSVTMQNLTGFEQEDYPAQNEVKSTHFKK